jgi:hypothetical protein
MNLSTILVAVGDLAAGVAAVAALVGLRFARQTVRDAQAAQAAGEVDRLYRRIEAAGEIIETMYRQGSYGWGFMRSVWTADRSRLGHAMVGLADRLPCCEALLDVDQPRKVHSAIEAARQEIRLELQQLGQQLRR